MFLPIGTNFSSRNNVYGFISRMQFYKFRKDMPQLKSTITLTWVDKIQYTFSLRTMDTEFPIVKAIYIIVKIIDSKYTLLYIWQTEDLSTRFSDHHKQECFDKNWANYIGVLNVESQEDRDRIEITLLQENNPICNDQHTV